MAKVMLIAIPLFFLTIFVDWLVMYLKGKKDYYPFSDTLTNLNLGVGSQVVAVATKFMILGNYDYIYRNFAFWELGNSWYIWVINLLLFDFIYYWAHRWGHEVNFFWGAHVVHHQSEKYNLSVALRQPWFHTLIAFPLFLPMALLGFNTLQLAALGAFITLYQYWIHTQAIQKMPSWFEFIFNTPSHHRVHHGLNQKYLDKNHAAFLIIWDRLFGTFQAEEESPDYGVTTRFNSANPVWANFENYYAMMKNALEYDNWKDRFKIFFFKPGWKPESYGGFQQPGEPDKSIVVMRQELSISTKFYLLLQFVVVAWGLMSYMAHFDELSGFYRVLFFSLLVLSLLISGAIIEKKSWVIRAEVARLVLGVVSVPTLYFYQFFDWFWITLPISVVLFIVFMLWLFFIRKQEHFEMSTLPAE